MNCVYVASLVLLNILLSAQGYTLRNTNMLNRGRVFFRKSRILSRSFSVDDIEYGFFPKTGKTSELDRQSEEFADKLRLFCNVDHLWSTLSDAQVQTGVSSLQSICTAARYEKLLQVANMRTGRVRMVFENPSNTNNLWAALRTFDAFGIQFADVIVDANAEIVSGFSQMSMVQAMGAQKWLTLSQHNSTVDHIKALKNEGYHIIASDLHSSSKRLQDIDWNRTPSPASVSTGPGKIAIVMGNEKFGISEDMRELADDLFYIPMKGFAESLNLSAATAVICAYLESQGALATPLDESTKQRVLLTWLTRSIHGSEAILRNAGLPLEWNRKMYEQICGVSSKP